MASTDTDDILGSAANAPSAYESLPPLYSPAYRELLSFAAHSNSI